MFQCSIWETTFNTEKNCLKFQRIPYEYIDPPNTKQVVRVYVIIKIMRSKLVNHHKLKKQNTYLECLGRWSPTHRRPWCFKHFLAIFRFLMVFHVNLHTHTHVMLRYCYVLLHLHTHVMLRYGYLGVGLGGVGCQKMIKTTTCKRHHKARNRQGTHKN